MQRAMAAWEAFQRGLWGGTSPLAAREPWVQELWARVADAVIGVAGDSIDAAENSELLKRKRALAACVARDGLEGRSGEAVWSTRLSESGAIAIWCSVVNAVMGV